MEEIEEEVIKYGITYQTDPREALLNVWQSYAKKTVERRSIRRPDGIYQAEVLFSFMRQLAQQGWTLTQGIPRESAEDARIMLRSLRSDIPTSCASCERGLDQQRPVECPDPLHILSSVLAFHAHQAWSEVFFEDAKGISPLAIKSPARVGRLRMYGDSIVIPQASAFIKAYIASRG